MTFSRGPVPTSMPVYTLNTVIQNAIFSNTAKQTFYSVPAEGLVQIAY